MSILKPEDIRFDYIPDKKDFFGHAKGVTITYLSNGFSITCDELRSVHLNKANAIKLMEDYVKDLNYYGSKRKQCGNCTIVDDYRSDELECHHCGHTEFLESHDLDDDYGIHHKNVDALKRAKEIVARLEHEIDKFEQGWFSSWNAKGPQQMNWETPTDLSSLVPED